MMHWNHYSYFLCIENSIESDVLNWSSAKIELNFLFFNLMESSVKMLSVLFSQFPIKLLMCHNGMWIGINTNVTLIIVWTEMWNMKFSPLFRSVASIKIFIYQIYFTLLTSMEHFNLKKFSILPLILRAEEKYISKTMDFSRTGNVKALEGNARRIISQLQKI